jgi:hypothetical protein
MSEEKKHQQLHTQDDEAQWTAAHFKYHHLAWALAEFS